MTHEEELRYEKFIIGVLVCTFLVFISATIGFVVGVQIERTKQAQQESMSRK